MSTRGRGIDLKLKIKSGLRTPDIVRMIQAGSFAGLMYINDTCLARSTKHILNQVNISQWSFFPQNHTVYKLQCKFAMLCDFCYTNTMIDKSLLFMEPFI